MTAPRDDEPDIYFGEEPRNVTEWFLADLDSYEAKRQREMADEATRGEWDDHPDDREELSY